MPTIEILKTYSVLELKREIGKARMKNYSKLKKAEVMDLMMKNKEKFHHLKGKVKAVAKPKTIAKPKAVEKPTAKKKASGGAKANKEPAHLPTNVMDNIKGFMNVGKDAKEMKDTVYQYVSGGKTYYLLNSKWYEPAPTFGKGAKVPHWWKPSLPEMAAHNTADAYVRILTADRWKEAAKRNRYPEGHDQEQTKIQKKIEESGPVYFIKTILPVLRQKDAAMKLAQSRPPYNSKPPDEILSGEESRDARRAITKRANQIKDDLKLLYLGETRKPRSKKLRFIKI